jgi:hypothetical protein
MEHYKKLSKIDVKGMTEKKNGLTYLTWSKAFGELLKNFPEATYEIKKFGEEGKPYFMDESGAMVFTSMTIEGITREMFLPVLDGANKPMKATSYKYTTKYGEKTCEAINMFHVNKTIMRCLVKNIAVFGLGLNIYAKEDLPLGEEIDLNAIKEQLKKMSLEEVQEFYKKNKGKGKEIEELIISRGKELRQANETA